MSGFFSTFRDTATNGVYSGIGVIAKWLLWFNILIERKSIAVFNLSNIPFNPVELGFLVLHKADEVDYWYQKEAEAGSKRNPSE